MLSKVNWSLMKPVVVQILSYISIIRHCRNMFRKSWCDTFVQWYIVVIVHVAEVLRCDSQRISNDLVASQKTCKMLWNPTFKSLNLPALIRISVNRLFLPTKRSASASSSTDWSALWYAGTRTTILYLVTNLLVPQLIWTYGSEIFAIRVDLVARLARASTQC